MKKIPVKKAVFPVAGLGTRFLPATKANPKEMLPIVDKPLIQYAVEEAIAAGIEELIFVTSYSKRAIEDHFDLNFELEVMLEKKGDQRLLNIVRDILPESVSCAYVRQRQALGLGHAILCAKNLVCDEPFAILLADDLIDGGQQQCLSQMLEVYHATGHSVIAVEEIRETETHKYGIVGFNAMQNRVAPVHNIVEKPLPKDAPSRHAVVGRYILTPAIFQHLASVKPGSGGEIQLTDGIAKLLQEEKVSAYQFHGKRYDCGSKLGYLEATVAYALQHPDLAQSFKTVLKKYSKDVA